MCTPASQRIQHCGRGRDQRLPSPVFIQHLALRAARCRQSTARRNAGMPSFRRPASRTSANVDTQSAGCSASLHRSELRMQAEGRRDALFSCARSCGDFLEKRASLSCSVFGAGASDRV